MRDLVKPAQLGMLGQLLWLLLFVLLSTLLAAVIARYYSEPLNILLRTSRVFGNLNMRVAENARKL